MLFRLRRFASSWLVKEPSIEASVGGNRVSLLRDGESCLPAMMEAIAAAEREILLEMYWFDSDMTGRWFSEALMHKARRGVTVRVIFDAIGSFGADREMFEQMRRAGCEVHEFNAISPRRRRFSFGMLRRRDHRKVLVVDGAIGFTGGINLADAWAPKPMGKGWRDDAVRVAGPAAAQFRAAFYEMWSRLDRRSGVRLERFSLEPEGASSPVRVVANFRRRNRHAIRREYLDGIRNAERVVYIANSYFVPDRAIVRALVAAAQRGVDVRVITAGNTDVLFARTASRFLYRRLLEGEVRVFEWTESVLHTKTAVVDDRCTVGSFNLDKLSWVYNHELNATIEDSQLARSMCDAFLDDARSSKRIDLARWMGRSRLQRLVEWLAYLCYRLL